ncbi:MAG: hypothetical protein LZ174_10105 [Thaumarchaeota archaeon]|jgi:hypothetical protein|nr:hypothetical protein [Candidatus Geocrenenecus arthurdayi]
MPPKPPQFFCIRKLRVIVFFITLIIVLSSLASLSVNLNIQAESFILGGSATYIYDAGNERVRSVRLNVSGDDVTGAQATCRKVKTDRGIYAVSVTFSNGVESRSGQATVYQDKGVEYFTVPVTFDSPISYYPNPSVSAECWKVS